MKQNEQFWNNLYKKTGSMPQSPFTQSLHEKILESIPEDVETILDAGCGGGALMAFLNQEKKYILEGVDQSSEGIRFIVQKMHLKAQVGDLCNLYQFEDNSFDMVVCSEVTEHIPLIKLDKVVAEMLRVARKYIIISNPFRELLTFHQVECQHCRTRYHPAGHIHSVDELFVKSLLDQHAVSVSFVYSGQRKWEFPLYAAMLRRFGFCVVNNLDISCPLCEIEYNNMKFRSYARLFVYAYSLIQRTLKNIGVYKPANIISLVKLK